jgi:hypothetical protein
VPAEALRDGLVVIPKFVYALCFIRLILFFSLLVAIRLLRGFSLLNLGSSDEIILV